MFVAILIISIHKEILRGVRRRFHEYWDYLGFITNSVLWAPLLVVETYESVEFPLILIITIPFVIMMFSRAIVVYGGSTFLRIFRVKIPLQ